MVVEAPEGAGGSSAVLGADGGAGRSDRFTGWLGALRSLLIWAGLITLVLLTLLALVHLVGDAWAARGVRVRFVPTALLAAAGGAVALIVAWLTGSTRRREMVAIAIGFAALVAVRLVISVQYDGATDGEPGSYVKMAASILTPEWDFAGRPMGYGFALAGSYLVTGDYQLAAEALNLLLAVLAGGVVLGLARGLYGPRVGALALLGYALWPAGALMTVVSLPQGAFDLAVVAGAWAAVGLPPGWRSGALVGVLLGLGQYLRPTAPVLLPAYILAMLWQGGRRRDLAAAVLAPVVTFLLVLIPVMAYNLDRSDSLSISTSDFGGHTLFIGTYEPSGGEYSRAANYLLIDAVGPDPRDRSELGTELALQRIREDPVGIAALGIRKQDVLWGTEHFGIQYGVDRSQMDRPQARAVTVPLLLSQAFYVFVLLTATLGLWLRRRQPDALAPLVITMIWAVSAVHALLEVRDRHHSYVIPLLLPLSAVALAAAWSAAERRIASRREA